MEGTDSASITGIPALFSLAAKIPDPGIRRPEKVPSYTWLTPQVGLLRRLAQLAPTAFGEGNRLFTEFKGALTENYVLQSLILQFEVMSRYWTQTNPPYEVDFLIQRENDIFPIEVKSEANTSSKSLKKFKELFPDQSKTLCAVLTG